MTQDLFAVVSGLFKRPVGSRLAVWWWKLVSAGHDVQEMVSRFIPDACVILRRYGCRLGTIHQPIVCWSWLFVKVGLLWIGGIGVVSVTGQL
jgi:hypothetical protein